MRESPRDEIVIDGVTIDLLDPAAVTPTPDSRDAVRDPDAAAAAATVVRPSGTVMGAVTALRPDYLSDAGLIDAMLACERLKAALDAKQAEFLTQLRRRDPRAEQFLPDEVACALHVAPGTAAEKLETAEALAGRLWDTGELLYNGHISHAHARILASATSSLTDEVTANVQQKVLRRAPGQTPGEFRASVRRAVAYFDRRDRGNRHREAVQKRRVVKEADADGMSWVHVLLSDDGAAVFLSAVNAWAAKAGSDDERTLDQRRADGAVELAMAGLAMPGVASAHGLKPVINVTLAASTLAGGDDQPGQLNGQPVTAAIARHWATHPNATWRYWAVDANGQVLDTDLAGRELTTGSYAPTPRIAGHVGFRDQSCVWPGCRRPASQSQIDHRTAWPVGPTTAGNLQILCKHHHDAKHRSRWRVHRTDDGAYDWISPTRHHYRYRPPERPVPIAASDPPRPLVGDEPAPF